MSSVKVCVLTGEILVNQTTLLEFVKFHLPIAAATAPTM